VRESWKDWDEVDGMKDWDEVDGMKKEDGSVETSLYGNE